MKEPPAKPGEGEARGETRQSGGRQAAGAKQNLDLSKQRSISLDAETIAKKALKIASEICVFTNDNIRCETVGRKAEEISENPPKKSRAKKADEKKEDK